MDPRQTILSLFPKARITSGYRGPGHPLTRKNPRSYHALGSPDAPRAVDVAPIPGVSFGDYVARLKSAGLPIAEALDEASHPRRHTTGPNWHIALGEAKPMLQPRKPARPGGILSDIPQPDPILTDVQNPLAMAQMQGGPLATNLEAPKPGFFGKGGKGWGILGILGDAMAAYGGQRGVFTPYMMQQQENELEDKRWRERLAAEAEVKRRLRLEAPEEITNSAGDRVRVYPDGTQEVLYMDPYGKPRTESRVNPATGALEIFNTGSTPRPTAEDIADLRRDPSLARDFDAEFGPGAAAYVLRMGGR